MNLNGLNFTNFQNVRVRGTGTDAGAIRLVANGVESTLSLNTTAETTLAHKIAGQSASGGIGVTGTFIVQLGAVSALDILSTSVAVAGLRPDAAIVASIQDMTTTGIGTRGFVYLGGITASNGFAHLTFVNPTNTATVYKPITVAYTAFR